MLLAIITKDVESTIAVDNISFLFSNILISDHKFGFIPGHAISDMLLLLSQKWMKALTVRHEIRAIFLNIS